MDLNGAKTVLIIAFLLLNIFLGYQLWQQDGASQFAYFKREGEQPRLESALEEAGFKMNISLPRGAMRLSHLYVEPVNLPRQELLDYFFPHSKELVFQKKEQAVHYLQGNKRLTIDPSKAISFQLNVERVETEITKEKAMELASEFLALISDTVQLKEDYQVKLEEGWHLHDSQEFNGFPIFSSYLHIVAAGEKIISTELYLLNPLNFSGQEREIIPVSTALIRFLEEYAKDARGREIIQINLGFYSPHYEAERWEIPPVWRILLNSGEVFYINAFTGHLEGR